jgi:chemotaxis protein histidine kinase CheA
MSDLENQDEIVQEFLVESPENLDRLDRELLVLEKEPGEREVLASIFRSGQIVTAIDLRRRLELRERPADRTPMNVVVRTDDGAVSLLVDDIGDVIKVQTETFEPPPETLAGITRQAG